MKKFYLFFISIIFCFLMISCSNLYQDFSTTTVEFTKEFIASIKSRASGDDGNCVIFATVTCGKKTQTKTVDIAEVPEANGVTLQFDKLPIGKTGTLYVSVGSKKAESELETYYSENIADLDAETQFTVQPNGNTKIKVTLNPATKYTAYFTTFTETENETKPSYPVITFTQNSTITAPLPVGTTRWQIYFNNLGKISYHGSFGEEIDVKKELMNYKNYFNYPEDETTYVQLEATGEPANKINTPIVYCSNEEEGSSTYKILGSNTPVLTPTSEIKDYCFDNAGNLYFSTLKGIFKVAYNHKENMYEENQDIFSNIGYGKLSYDKAQNYLYVCSNYLEDTQHLTRIQNPAGGIYKDFNSQNPTSFNWNKYPLEPGNNDIADPSFTVHNGILYVSKIQRTEQGDSGTKYSYSLVLQKGSIETGTFDDTTVEYEILSNAQNGLSGTTDIMFQDGSLYIIFSCYNGNWDGSKGENIYYNYSTGGIVKYNIESEQFDKSLGIKGFVDTPNTITNIGTSNSDVYYYAPTSGNNGTESKYFYGPKQFVAIMPKKLVFLDSGADVSSYANYDDDDIPSKSRIVEYDLSTNSFSSTEITGTDLGFNFSGNNISF